ncbi:MAG: exo-beta-N-acetylmuramidase NamZ domain-containing protein [Fimbriimonadaceae bacterium]
MVLTGLDCLVSRDFDLLRGRNVALLCNQATITRDGRHIFEHILEAHLQIKAIFGPQHGLFGHTQDNMIEWEGRVDARLGAPVYSLYGEHRKPTPQMLAGTDLLVIDLPDIGSRYYTFAWTRDLGLSTSRFEVELENRERPRMGSVPTCSPNRTALGASFAKYAIADNSFALPRGMSTGRDDSE